MSKTGGVTETNTSHIWYTPNNTPKEAQEGKMNNESKIRKTNIEKCQNKFVSGCAVCLEEA